MRLFAKSPCLVAEGPRWRTSENRLYWVDVTGGEVFRQNSESSSGDFERFAPGLGKIGALAFADAGELLLFTDRCEIYRTSFGGKPECVARLAGHSETRFNDVFDAGGGVYFCGVAPVRPNVRGELWRIDLTSGSFICVEPSTEGMPNGMGVSPDSKTFYFIVTDERRIYAYDFEAVTRMVSNRRVLIDAMVGSGKPDGMCVDPADGSLLVAYWDGARLERRRPDGSLSRMVSFPMPRVTSVEVAGDAVYVTTANFPRDERLFTEMGAGGVFVLTKGEI